MAEAVLTDIAEEQTLRWYRDPAGTSTAPPVPPVPPYRLRLLTALGSDSATGTAVTGPSATDQVFDPGVPYQDGDGDYVMANEVVMRWDALDAATVVGAEIWDSATTPVRWAHGPLVGNVTVAQGAPFELAAGKCRWKVR